MKLQVLLRTLYGAQIKTIASSTLYRPFCSAASSFALKNVTNSNFDSSLDDLRRHVRDADFVSIDLEMTGVTSAPWRDSFPFDRSDVRYLKIKDSAEKFAVIQFGVCPFRWDPLKLTFVAHPHNVYLFPRQELPFDGPSYEFLCQTTSIDFLSKYQFDFNACVREGVSYLSRAQEEEALRRLNSAYEDELSEQWHNLKDACNRLLVSMGDVLFTKRMKNRISEWRDGLLRDRNEGSQFQGSSSDSKQHLQTIFFNMRPALTLNGFTSHQLRLIQMVTRKHFKDLIYVRVNGEDSCLRKLIVYTESENDKNLLMKEVKDRIKKEAELKIEAAVRFRHVIDLLSSEKKLIVGHNCFLDFAHVYSKFIGPLPLSPEEFVSSIHGYFPHIIDTKILLNTSSTLQNLMKKKSTTLSKAFALLCPEISSSFRSSSVPFKPCVKVEVRVDDMRSSNWNSGAKHEAGYDAFMTGCVFAQACDHLDIDFKLASNLVHNDKLQDHINLLYLSWTGGDIIDLTNTNRTIESSSCSDPNMGYRKISFANIVLLWGFLPSLKAREIRECLTKAFGHDSVTSVYHLDETAVFVQFGKVELVSKFLNLKDTLERNNDPISVLHPFGKLFEGGNTRAAGYEVYKEICGSPISKVLFADQAEAFGIKWKTKLVEWKEGVETQKHGDPSKEIRASKITTGSGKYNKTWETKKVVNGTMYSHLSYDKLIDSLLVKEL